MVEREVLENNHLTQTAENIVKLEDTVTCIKESKNYSKEKNRTL